MEGLKAFGRPKTAMMLVLGFTAGLPFLLYYSTLSVWLKESEIEETVIAFFSWFGLAYSFKFFWAPVIDRISPPGLSRIFGRRRSWIFVAQIGIAFSMIGIGMSDPATNLAMTALFAFLLALSSATQDIGVDAWRIEAAENDDEQATLAAAYQYGYKVGMVVAGGIALIIAGSTNFHIAYWAMAGAMGLGALVFAIWDRKFGLQAAAAAGALLLSLGIATAFGQFHGVVEDGTVSAMIFKGVELLFYAVCALSTITFVVAAVFALRDRPEGSEFTVSGFVTGLGFSIAIFVSVAILTAALGLIVPKVVAALGWEPSRSEIANLALYIAAAPILACAIAIPFVRALKTDAPILKNPTLAPFLDFFWRHGWIALLILLFVSSYRLSDIVMGIMAKPAYIEMGYSATDIGLVSGTYGPWIIFVGTALAGVSALTFGLRLSLIIGAIVSVLGNLTFSWLVNQSPDSLAPLFIAVTADNIAGGYAGTVFVAFLSTMVAKSFAGTQYAIFSSIYTLGPKLIAGASGAMVASFSGGTANVGGYSTFFLVAGAMGIPAILLSIFTKQMKPDRERVLEAPGVAKPK